MGEVGLGSKRKLQLMENRVLFRHPVLRWNFLSRSFISQGLSVNVFLSSQCPGL